MPINWTVHPNLGLALFVYTGDVAVAENLAAYLGYIKSADFDPDRNLLVDETQCRLIGLDYQAVSWLSRELEPFYAARSPASRSAFLCPGDDPYATTRMYGAVASTRTGRDLLICRSKAEALAALGLDPDDPALHRQLWPGQPPAIPPPEDTV